MYNGGRGASWPHELDNNNHCFQWPLPTLLFKLGLSEYIPVCLVCYIFIVGSRTILTQPLNPNPKYPTSHGPYPLDLRTAQADDSAPAGAALPAGPPLPGVLGDGGAAALHHAPGLPASLLQLLPVRDLTVPLVGGGDSSVPGRYHAVSRGASNAVDITR